MRTAELRLDTSGRRFVDLTPELRAFAEASSSDGLAHVFVPHATAGLALMETGSGSEEDLEDAMERLLPRDNRYRHAHGSRGHGADHLLPAFLAPTLSVPVVDGRLMLGRWQSVLLVDPNQDNPERRVILSFLEG
jgi:secondary thiamine-phosphate synthase enzyme